MPDNKVLACGGCCCCSALIATIIMVAVSIKIVEPTQMALDLDKIMIKIDEEKLWTNGRHFIGLGHEFIRFPREQQEIKFPDGANYNSLTARTKDGLRIEMDVSFQFTLLTQVDMITELYYTWGYDYSDAYSTIARSVLRDVAAMWYAYDFFANRTNVERQMFNDLSPALFDVAATLETLQLMDVRFPVQFDNMLQETEAVRQGIKRAIFEQEDAGVQAEARVMRVYEEANVITNQKETEAQLNVNEIEKQRLTLIAQLTAEREAFMALEDETGMRGRELINYIWLNGMLKGSSDAFINMEKPEDVQCFADPRTCLDGPSLNGETADVLTYACTDGVACVLEVPGSGLTSSDRVRLSSDCAADDAPAWPTPPNLANAASPVDSSSTVRKAFRVGTPNAAGTYQVCYCTWSQQLFGCGDLEAFSLAGTLTVT